MALLNNPQGQVVTVPVTAGMELEFGFDPGSEAQLSRDGDNLIFTFEDGGQIVLTDFYAQEIEQLPTMDIQGAQISAEDFLASLGDETLLPAAGPAAPAAPASPDSSGSGAYGDSAGNLIGGIDYLGMLGRIFWSQPVGEPLTEIGIEMPGGDFNFDVGTDDPSGVGFMAAGAFEDAMPNQHLGDNALNAGHITFNFTPSGTTTVTGVHLSGFDPGTRIFIGDPNNGGVELQPGPGGVYNFSQADFTGPGVYFIPPENSDHDMILTAVVDLATPSGGTATGTYYFEAIVDAVADKPDFVEAGIGIDHDGYDGALAFDEGNRAQTMEDGWAKDNLSKTSGADVDPSGIVLTVHFNGSLSFGDFKDGSEQHFALVEVPSVANISNPAFAPGDWTVKTGSESNGLKYYDTVTIRYVNGMAYDTLADAQAHGWQAGGEEKTFFRFEVDNAFLRANVDPANPSRANAGVSFEMEGRNTGITEDVSFKLDAGAQAKENPDNSKELSLDNNNSYTWASDGEDHYIPRLIVDTVDSKLNVQVGWASEDNNALKHGGLTSTPANMDDLNAAGADRGSAPGVEQGSTAGVNGAPIMLSITNDVSLGEYISEVTFTLPAGSLLVDGVELTAANAGGAGYVHGNFTYVLSGNTVTVTASGINETSLNNENITFRPDANGADPSLNFSDDDVSLGYKVTVVAPSGASATYNGSLDVVIDAVADKPTGLDIQSDHGTANNALQPGEAAVVFGEATFADNDGSEKHYVVVTLQNNAWHFDGLTNNSELLSKDEINNYWRSEGGMPAAGVNPAVDSQLLSMLTPDGNAGADARPHYLLIETAYNETTNTWDVTFYANDGNGGLRDVTSLVDPDHSSKFDPTTGKLTYDVGVVAPANATTDGSVNLYTKAITLETDPGDGEYDYANNISVNGAADVTKVYMSPADVTLNVTAGQAYEGDDSDKNLITNPADSYNGGAAITFDMNSVTAGDNELVKEMYLKLDQMAEGVIEGAITLNGVEIPNGVTLTFNANGTCTWLGDDGSTGSVNATWADVEAGGLKFIPEHGSFTDADVTVHYGVSVVDPDSGDMIKFTSNGDSDLADKLSDGTDNDVKVVTAAADVIVDVDAVADLSTTVTSSINAGDTNYKDIVNKDGKIVDADGTAGHSSASTGAATADITNSDIHTAPTSGVKGWETDTFKLDYSDVKYAFGVNVNTTFPDTDGSEQHFILVQQPLDSAGNVDANWQLGTLPAGYKPAADSPYTDASGNKYFKIEVEDPTQGPVNVQIPLVHNGPVSGDVDLTLKTGSLAVEMVAGDAAGHLSGNEPDLTNNEAFRQGTLVNYTADVINSQLTVKTGWGSEGGQDYKHIGTSYSSYEAGGNYAGSTGANGAKAQDGWAPITLGLSGAAGDAESITSITFTLPAGAAGTLVLANGMELPHTGNFYTLAPNATSATVYFKPADGSRSYDDVKLDYEVTVKNGAGSTYTFKGDSTVVIDAVADKPTFTVATDGSQVIYPNMIDPDTKQTVEQKAAAPGDEVTVQGKVTFPDVSGGENHFILVENGKTSKDTYDVQSVTIKAGSQSLTVSDFSGYQPVPIGNPAVTYYKIPVDNANFTNGDKIGTFDVAVTIKTTDDNTTHTNSVGFGGRAEVADVPGVGDLGGTPAGAASGNYEFDDVNNTSNTVTSVAVQTNGIETKLTDILAQGGATYEHDWAKNHLPVEPYTNVAGTATDDSNEDPSGGVNIGMTAKVATGEYISTVEITLWEPVDANKDGKPDSPTSWQMDGTRGHIVYNGNDYYPDANGKITLNFTPGVKFDPSKVVFVADGHESGQVQLNMGVTVTDPTNGYFKTFGDAATFGKGIIANVDVDAVATRSGAIEVTADFGDPTHTAVATGETFTLNIKTSFMDLDGSENKYVLIEQVVGFEPTGPYTVSYYDLDGSGARPYYKIAVTDAMINAGTKIDDVDEHDNVVAHAHTGVELTVPVELRVTADEEFKDGYNLRTGTAVEETRIDHNAEAGDYNNVAVRQGPIETVLVSDAHGGSRSESVWAYENDRPAMHEGNQSAKLGVDLPVGASMSANDAISGPITIHIDPADIGTGVFTYGGAPLNFDPITGNATAIYDQNAKLHFTPNDKVYSDDDIPVTISGTVQDALSGDTSGFSSVVTIKMDAVASLPGLENTPTDNVSVDYSGVVHNLSGAHDPAADNDAAATELARGGGTIELNNIKVSFSDFDGSEQHFLLIEKKPGLLVGGQNDWQTLEQPVYDNGNPPVLTGHIIYYKIPLDGVGAIDGSYVDWSGTGDTRTATIDHLSVTMPAYRYGDQDLDSLSYGGLAVDHTSGDAELMLHNNWAINTGGSIDINWGSGGGSGVWVEGLYEDNRPNAHVNDPTVVYGQINGLAGAAPEGADSVKITIPRGVLVNSSDPNTAQEYTGTTNPDGSTTYVIPKDDYNKIFVKLPSNDNLDTDLGLQGGGDSRIEYSFVETTTTTTIAQEMSGEFNRESSLVLLFEPKDALTITLPDGLEIIDKDGNSNSPIFGWERVMVDGVPTDVLHIHRLGGYDWTDLLPGIKFEVNPGHEGFDMHSVEFVLQNGKDLSSSIGGFVELKTTTTTTTVVTETDPVSVDVWVDAVAQMPLAVAGDATKYSDGDNYAESGETVTLHVNAQFQDIDATTKHYVLIEARPGWVCVDGNDNPYEISYVDGKAYYRVPATPAADGTVSMDVRMQTPDVDGLPKNSDGTVHMDFKVGALSSDQTVGDGEIRLDNNTSVLFPADAAVSVAISPVDSQISVSVGKGYEDNLGGGDGIAVQLSGLSTLTLPNNGGAQETLSEMTFSFKEGAGSLWYNGTEYSGTTAGGITTVTIPGFDPSQPLLRFVPADNHSAKDVQLDWSCKVTDNLSGETETFSGAPIMVIDAVAHAPTAVGEDTLSQNAGADFTAVTAGGSLEATFSVTFVNDSGDQKFILVESLPQWALQNGAGFEKVYPSGSPTAAGGVFYKIPVDLDNLPTGWSKSLSADGKEVTVNAKVTILAPNSLTGDGDVDIRYGGMTYDANAAGDGETSLMNNVAYNTSGTMDVEYHNVQSTTISASSAGGEEDGDKIAINFAVNDAATTGDAVYSVTFKAPAGGTTWVNGTAYAANASVTVAAADMDKVSFEPGANWSGDVKIDITAGKIWDPASGAMKDAGTLTDGTFKVLGVADAPSLADATTTVAAGHQVALNLGATYGDLSGEDHYFLVQLPTGLNPPAGTTAIGATELTTLGLSGIWYKVDAAADNIADATGRITLTAAENYAGGDVSYVAVSKETGSFVTGKQYAESAVKTITVDMPNVAPVATPVTGAELAANAVATGLFTAADLFSDADGDARTLLKVSYGGTEKALPTATGSANAVTLNGQYGSLTITLTATGYEYAYALAAGVTVTPADQDVFSFSGEDSHGLAAASDSSLSIGFDATHMVGDGAAIDASAQVSGVIIHGTSGAETITSSGHGDIIHAGAGDDTIYGGVGDTIHGDAGANTIHSAGDSIIHGGVDNDTIYGAGGDEIHGGAGNDLIDARAATSGVTIDGGAGNDTIYGSHYADIISGGEGDDIIHGGGGGDTLTGGLGDDTFVWHGTDVITGTVAVDHITDFSMGGLAGNGDDHLDLSDLITLDSGKTLDNYLTITQTPDGSAKLEIHTDGNIDNAADHVIVLDNVYASHSDGGANDTAAVDELIKQHIILNS